MLCPGVTTTLGPLLCGVPLGCATGGDAGCDVTGGGVELLWAAPPQGEACGFGLRGFTSVAGTGFTIGTRALLSPWPGIVEGAAGPEFECSP